MIYYANGNFQLVLHFALVFSMTAPDQRPFQGFGKSKVSGGEFFEDHENFWLTMICVCGSKCPKDFIDMNTAIWNPGSRGGHEVSQGNFGVKHGGLLTRHSYSKQ